MIHCNREAWFPSGDSIAIIVSPCLKNSRHSRVRNRSPSGNTSRNVSTGRSVPLRWRKMPP
jgi:hypothetical protein